MVSGAPPTARAEASGFADEVRSLEAHGGSSNVFMEAALRRMAQRPAGIIWHTVKAPWRLFNSGSYPGPVPIKVGMHVVSNLVWLLGIMGAVWTIRRRWVSVVPLIVCLAVLLPHLPLHTEARYTAPLRLFLVMYAGVAVEAAWRSYVNSRTSVRDV
jgi:hypothetical protein